MTSGSPALAAVLFDRDGTLIHDVPYNGDPDLVVPVDGAQAAVRRVREAGIPVGLISNQSGIGRGLITHRDVVAVNRRLQDLVGRLDVCLYCPHSADVGCHCRKPAPGLVLIASEILEVDPESVVVIGDTEADVRAAEAAGASGILVPNEATRADEVVRAALVADDLAAAVSLALTQVGTEAHV